MTKTLVLLDKNVYLDEILSDRLDEIVYEHSCETS
nr:MAG TPA: hypothetical protein [Caudoviricetes sp.]